MPRKRTRRSRVPDHQLLIFEIKTWEPSYAFSVKGDPDTDEEYSEYAELHLDTTRVYPDQYAGRPLKIAASSRRGLFERRNRFPKPEKAPDSIGLLELRPSHGSFYAGVPQESLPFILTGLAAGEFRYVMLSGPSLKRGHSFTTGIHFARTVD